MILHDTLSNEHRELKPLGDEVRMYVCGVTPYSQSHVGHALKAVAFDVLRRYLEWAGYRVRHIENFTDIDDKLIARSQELGIDMGELAEMNIQDYVGQLHRLNVLPAHEYPRVTQMVPQVCAMIQGLIDRGHAYEAGGDVYYRVRSFPSYGRLSKRNLDDLKSGARIDPTELKDDPLDFALWKTAKPGEMSWESPWGPGRPGWHIECSAMALETLGEQIDIHGGGADLVFPHHENEIAQSEGYTGKPFAQFWLHCALLQMGGEKMSKSIGNIVSIGEALDTYGPDAFRMLVLQSHYRSPVTYSPDAMDASRTGAERLRAAAFGQDQPGASGAVETDGYRERFADAMNNDLNTPQAVAVLFELSREVNRGRSEGRDTADASALLRELAGVLGLSLAEDTGGSAEAAPFIDLLIALRSELRSAKQFQLADTVRDRLAELGVEVKDGPQGSTWQYR
ncbi:MAG: cysteine--tRNA ligase [Dehalococcoidia bacterium]|nr:cysteine--tRNA ligase [Dehalococcoidia bacterium]